jgi:hypothetical protein
MKTLTFVLLYLICFVSKSQEMKQVYGGLSYLVLDAPDNSALCYSVGYSKFSSNKKTKLEISLNGSYLYKNNFEQIFGMPENDERTRVFINSAISYAPFKFKNNYFRVGIGPSLIYYSDRLINSVKFDLLNLKSPNVYDTPIYKSHTTITKKNLLPGGNAFTGFDFILKNRLTISPIWAFTLTKCQFIQSLNLNIGYSLNKK